MITSILTDPQQAKAASTLADLTSIACRQIPRLSSQHCEHHDGHGQHGLCDQGVPSGCAGALGHDQVGHLRSHSAPCPSGQLPGSFRRLHLCQVCRITLTLFFFMLREPTGKGQQTGLCAAKVVKALLLENPHGFLTMSNIYFISCCTQQ